MTDEPEATEDPGISVPYQLADGDFLALDPDFLDVTLEIIGVLAIQHSMDRGTWVLIGSGEGSDYHQVWKPFGEPPSSKPVRTLKTV